MVPEHVRLGVLALACAAVLAAAAPAAAAQRRQLCTDRVALRASPAGFVIGHLYRPQTLTVLGSDEPKAWALVRKRRLRGWVPWRALCEG
jgi:hypothetical protein